MKIGYVQFHPLFGETDKNLEKTISLIRKGKEADLLVLPELCTSGYLFKDKSELQKLSEKIPGGPCITRWEEIAAETNTYLVAGICEKDTDNEFYNSAALIGPNGFIDVYRKIHLFDSEKKYFKPGNDKLKIYNIGKARIGIIICFDWIFPEITRILSLNGADIICHPANLVLPYAQTTMLGRSIENRIYTITANRIGDDIRPGSKLSFTGLSQITNPKMELLAQAKENNEEVRIVEIDPSIARNKMVTNRNHIFQDRRIELYKPILNEIKWEKNGK